MRKVRQRFVGWVMKPKRGGKQEQTYHYIKWTLLIAIAVVIAGLIALGLSALR